MLIDIYEIQDCISAEDYDAICRGDDAVTEESIESARAYVGLVADKFGIEYDEEDPAIRLAVETGGKVFSAAVAGSNNWKGYY